MKLSNRSGKIAQSLLTVILTATLLAGLMLQSFRPARFADEIWKQLGISREDGNTNISTTFLQGYLAYYGAKNIKNIAVGNRAAVVNELGSYAKQYVNSEAFKKEYLQNRESRKPEVPRPAKSAEEIRKEQIEGMEKSVKEMEAMGKIDNPDLKKAAKEGLEFLKTQLKEYSDPKSQLIKMMADGEKMSYENNMAHYKEEMIKWEKENPANPSLLVKARLEEFLAVTADVDYSAALKEQYGKKRFVNPLYESKSTEWKQAFRAGKETTDAARAFAQQWLKEIK